ncbi:hypothetical protein RDI58_018199 [Solanum bulbocastanum]|uniref:Uncharacterized protein n=1 Tax=Solanum bulbocastanum TaxID=147425 RepID=A0AAN8TDR2_SOLBU
MLARAITSKVLRKAFLARCRKCIGLDGCFLKSVTKRQLLVDVARDANNQMLPIAWSDDRDYTFISDMQKGLTSIIMDLLPEV